MLCALWIERYTCIFGAGSFSIEQWFWANYHDNPTQSNENAFEFLTFYLFLGFSSLSLSPAPFILSAGKRIRLNFTAFDIAFIHLLRFNANTTNIPNISRPYVCMHIQHKS